MHTSQAGKTCQIEQGFLLNYSFTLKYKASFKKHFSNKSWFRKTNFLELTDQSISISQAWKISPLSQERKSRVSNSRIAKVWVWFNCYQLTSKKTLFYGMLFLHVSFSLIAQQWKLNITPQLAGDLLMILTTLLSTLLTNEDVANGNTCLARIKNYYRFQCSHHLPLGKIYFI